MELYHWMFTIINMKVLSLFDGISCARVALERAGIVVEVYYASEIDKYATQTSSKNYPDIVRVGDVKNLVIGGRWSGDEKYTHLHGDIDLLIGGSPCQDLSIAKKDRKGLDGERSGLFWEYVRILKEVKPKYFILENVASMPKEAKAIITETLGVEPIMINAALVSAQQRKRLFWTNIPNITQPEDRGIFLKDILESGDVDRLKSYCIDASYYKGANWEQYKEKGRRQLVIDAVALTEKRTEEAKKLRKEHREKTGKDYSPRRGNLTRQSC
jgi:DNA-cytosine methyltransferase